MSHFLFSKPSMFASVICLALTSCSTQREYFALSPGVGSAIGTMQIKSREKASAITFTLNDRTPVAMMEGDQPQAANLNAADLRARFTGALGAQPPASAHFTLYFTEGGDILTASSQTAINALLDAIRQRPAPDVVVIGHTDRVGSPSDNDKLSQVRAQSIRQMLVARGIDADNIQATGRGERELLVETADEVAEPRNRRVEILLR